MIYVLRQWAKGSIDGVRWHLARHNLAHQMINAYEIPHYPELQAGDTIIGLGGPPSVVRLGEPDYETPFMTYEAGFIGHAMLGHVSFLGICLSHQLRAKLSNNPVEQRSLEEGFTEVRLNDEGRRHWLFEGMPEKFRVFEYHQDQVTEVRHGGTLLGGSDSCPVQAIDWGENSVSVQFHPEVLLAEIDKARPASSPLPPAADYERYVNQFFDNFFRRAGVI